MVENISGKQKIINAYLDLLKTKQFNKITVSSIIRKADVLLSCLKVIIGSPRGELSVVRLTERGQTHFYE